MDVVIDTLHASKPADLTHLVMVPGEPERLARAEREKVGILIQGTMLDQLRKIANAAGVPYVLE